MALTKTEKKKLNTLKKRAVKLAQDTRKLAKDVGRELVRQMRKS